MKKNPNLPPIAPWAKLRKERKKALLHLELRREEMHAAKALKDEAAYESAKVRYIEQRQRLWSVK